MEPVLSTNDEDPDHIEKVDQRSRCGTILNDPTQKFRRFSCSTMQRQLTTRMSLNPNHSSGPFSESLFASVCLADISGFTRLSARLSAEQLKAHINEYFTILLGVIRQNHGDVIKFLGDAVLILWPVAKDASDEVQAAATVMACVCALQLLKDCGSYDRGDGENKVELRLHCGVVCGVIHTMCLGEGDRWEYIVSGVPLKAVGEAESEASTGECCLSPEAYDKVCEHFEAILMPKGSYRLTGFLKQTSYIATRYIEEVMSQKKSNIDRPYQLRKFSSTSGYNSNISRKFSSSSLLSSSSNSDKIFPTTPKRSLPKSSSSASISQVQSQTVLQHSISSKSTDQLQSIINKQFEPLSRSLSYIRVSSLDTSGFNPGFDLNLLSSRTTSTKIGSFANHKSLLSVYENDSSLQQPVTFSADTSPGLPTPAFFMTTFTSLARSVSQRNMSIQSSSTVSIQDPFEVIRSVLNDSSDFIEVRAFLEGFLAVDEDDDEDDIFDDAKFKQILRSFVHVAARVAIENGTDAYLPELRQVVTIFVEILEMDDDLNRGLLGRPQEALSAMLDVLKNFGGSLRQYVVDDKGCVMIAAFGLPDSSHEDNCVRAVEVAVALRPRFTKLGIKCRIGISEGKVYCGVVGSITDRCEYAMMGLTVNLAARLMGKCGVNEILVSETVHDAASSAFTFLELDKVQAKGFANPVGVFRPIERSDECNPIGADDFIGRTDELEMFATALSQLQHTVTDEQTKSTSSKPHAFMIQGGAGVGKSRLISEVLKIVKERQMPITSIQGFASMSRVDSPYYVIRQLLERIFNFKSCTQLTRKSIVPLKKMRTVQKQESGKFSLILDIDADADDNLRQEHPVAKAVKDWILARTETFSILEERYIALIQDVVGNMESTCSTECKSAGLMSIRTHGQGHGHPTGCKHSSNPSGSTPLAARLLSRDRSVKSLLENLSSDTTRSTPPVGGVFTRDRSVRSLFGGNERRSSTSSLSLGRTLSSKSLQRISSKKCLLKEPSQRGFDDKRIEDIPLKLIDLIPLLCDVLSCPLHDNEITSAMKPVDRRHIGSAFALRLLLLAIETGHSLIVVDNIQWIDIQSLQILNQLVVCMNKGIFVGVRRVTGGKNCHSQVTELTVSEQRNREELMSAMLSKCTIVPLKQLSVLEVRKMLSKTMGLSLLTAYPDLVSPLHVSQLLSRAGGSPFHAFALAKQMKAAVISKCFTGVNDLPAGAQNIVVARFDQLNNAEQVTLRTSAIIGLKFSEVELAHTLRALEYDTYATTLSSLLGSLVEHHLIVVDDSSSDNRKLYKFADRSVQETVYNLMISTVRENVHGIVGKFLEESQEEGLDRFYDIVRHYLYSDIIGKKIEYLYYAALKSERMHLYTEMLKCYEQMIQMVTGYESSELKNVMCRKVLPDELPSNTLHRHGQRKRCGFLQIRVTVTNESDSEAGTDRTELFRTARVRRWIDSSDIIKTCKVLTELDSSIASTITPAVMSTWLCRMGLAHRMLGNLPECSNLLQLALHHANVYAPRAEKLETQRRRQFMTYVYRLFVPIKVPLLKTENALFVYLRMLHTEAALLSLRGYALQALETLQMARCLQEKFIRHRDLNQKLSNASSNNINVHTNTPHKRQLKRQMQTLTLCGDSLSVIALISYSTHVDIVDIIHDFVVQSEMFDDPIIFICRAVIASGEGEFYVACGWLAAAMETSLAQFDRHMHHVANVFRAWLLFLSGRPNEAKEAVTIALQSRILTSSSSSLSHTKTSISCAHLWFLELEIMLHTMQSDFESAETIWKFIRASQEKDRWRFGPTTAAIVAFSLVQDGRFNEADPYATYACRRLAERYQCNIVVGTILFCAIYAAMDILEAFQEDDGKPDFVHKYKKTTAGIALFQAMSRFEQMANSFPSLSLLNYAVQCRKVRIFPGYNGTALLAEIDTNLLTSAEFVFGGALFHLEKAKLYHMLGINENAAETSRRISRNNFRQLGMVRADNLHISTKDSKVQSGSASRKTVDGATENAVYKSHSNDGDVDSASSRHNSPHLTDEGGGATLRSHVFVSENVSPTTQGMSMQLSGTVGVDAGVGSVIVEDVVGEQEEQF